MTQLLLALAAGILTVAAPCILPMLPILLGATIGKGSRARPLFITLGFVLAFSAVALLFNAFAAALETPASVLREIAIVLLVVFGILMIVPHPFRWLAARMHRVVNKADEVGRQTGPGNAGGFVLGATLGIVWTPFAGPYSVRSWPWSQPHRTWPGPACCCSPTRSAPASVSRGAGVPRSAVSLGRVDKAPLGIPATRESMIRS